MSTDFTPVSNGQVIDAEDVNRYIEPIQDLESGAAFYRVAAGSGSPYTVSFTKLDNPNHHLDSLSPGQLVIFKANTPSPANASLQVAFEGGANSGPIPLYVGNAQVGVDEIDAEQILVAVYNDTSTPRFDLIAGASSGGGGGSTTLAGLTDVNLGTPTDGQVLQYDSGTSKFVNADMDVSDLSGTLPVSSGGTGATDASGARTNLGAQAQNDSLDEIAAQDTNFVKGDIVVHDGSVLNRLPAGSNGQVLEADSAQSTGLKWSTPSGGGGGATDLDGLTDVTITGTPGTGEILRHDGTDFKNTTPSAAGLVETSRSVSTTAPLSGGGALSSDLTLSMPAAGAAQDGYLTSTDWNDFDGKQDALTGTSDVPGLDSALSGKQSTSEKGQANGYASLDGTGKVPSSQLPAGGATIGAGQVGYGAASTGNLTSDANLTYDGSSLIYSGSNPAQLKGSGTDSVAVGSSSSSSGSGSVSVGYDSDASGVGSVAVGRSASAVGTQGIGSTAVGHNASAGTLASVAVGYNASVTGDTGTALGYGASAAIRATALGEAASAAADSSVALGRSALADATHSVALGRLADAGGLYAIACGPTSVADGHSSLAIGSGSSASGSSNIAIGNNADASGTYRATAVGLNAVAQGSYDIAIGQGASATGSGSNICIGIDASSTAAGSVVVGSYADSTAGGYGVSIGYLATSAGEGIALGYNSDAAARSIAIGYSCEVNNSAQRAVAIGYGASTSAWYSMALGNAATASSQGRVSIGGPMASVFYLANEEVVFSGSRVDLHAPPRTGTNLHAGDFYINGSQPTGTGDGGDIIFRTAPTGSTSGTTRTSLVNRLHITGDNELGLFGVTPVPRSTGWSVSNGATRKTFDPSTVTLSELAEVVGTLVDYLKSLGPLGA